MAYHVQFLTTLKDICPEKWQPLEIISCYQSYHWLLANEYRDEKDARYKGRRTYILITDMNHDLLSVLPCYNVAEDNISATYNIHDITQGKLAKEIIPKFLSPEQLLKHQEYSAWFQANNLSSFFPNLLCAIRHGYAPVPLFHKGLDEKQKMEIAHLIVNSVSELCQKFGCSSMSFLYITQENPIYKALSARDFLNIHMAPDAWLKVDFKNFEEYLQSKSNKRRYSIRREIQHFNKSLYSRRKTLPELPIPHLGKLFCQLEEKYAKIKLNPEGSIAYIEDLKKIDMKNQVHTAYNPSNEIVGFSLLYEYNDISYVRICGFDYEQIKNDFCYFNIVFYLPIMAALTDGMRMIHYGIASLETKISRGCDVLPLFGFFKILNSEHDMIEKNIQLINIAQQEFLKDLKIKHRFEILTESDLMKLCDIK